jgi:hypothetical protein
MSLPFVSIAYTPVPGSRDQSASNARNAASPSCPSTAAATSIRSAAAGADATCAAALRWRSQIADETPTTVATCASMKKAKNFQNRRPTAYSRINW